MNRPLSQDAINYAAFDVVVLFELADLFGIDTDQKLSDASTRYANTFIHLTETNKIYFEHSFLPLGILDFNVGLTWKCICCSRNILRQWCVWRN
jgi:hypothetical protein